MSAWHAEKWSVLADWISAAATSFAAITALFLARDKTKLILHVQPGPAPLRVAPQVRAIDLIMENKGPRQIMLRSLSVRMRVPWTHWKFIQQIFPSSRRAEATPLSVQPFSAAIDPGKAETFSVFFFTIDHPEMIAFLKQVNRAGVNFDRMKFYFAVKIHTGKVTEIRIKGECLKFIRELLGIDE